MLLKVQSASVLGIEAQIIDVEVDLSLHRGRKYHVVGLPDVAIKESGERVRAAIQNCGYKFPHLGSITVNLAPADFKKEGSCSAHCPGSPWVKWKPGTGTGSRLAHPGRALF